jgi:hypothetical protein
VTRLVSNGSSLKSPITNAGRAGAVHLEGPLVEVRERLAGYVSEPSRFRLPSAAGGPVVPEHCPRSPTRYRPEVDLQDFAGGVPAHHHMEKGLVRRDLEPLRVIQERNVDAACVIGVTMYDLVLTRRQHSFDRLDEQVQHESVLELAYSQEVRTRALVHLHDH